MPTYVYRREDGSTFEIEQRITAPPLVICPTTGQNVVRIITTGAGLLFKGSGFYLTDYARSGSQGAPADGSSKTPKSDSSEAAGDGDATSTKKEASAGGSEKPGAKESG